ncbi:MAG: hypothetical protein E7370_06140 [Clostridiales bacterium]|nr:hypothetical protein [Clostridiales bacterium]
MADLKTVKNLINPKKDATKQFFLQLLDGEKQKQYEDSRISAVMAMLRHVHVNKLKKIIERAESEIKKLTTSREYSASDYQKVLQLKAEIKKASEKINSYKCFFDEPYFARMDLTDEKEGYNSYYIGKHGDESLEIVDWRAPLARKYYQKSQLNFSINEYDYKLILRRALRTKNGKVLEIQNEYLNLKDYLTKEEIGGRDEEVIFDPFLKDILKTRKESSQITDIIQSIQEKQYEIITLPEGDEFVVQGVAGSGKTMILLHRLSFLMYNNERIKPRDVLVITPSDSFNDFIDELSQILELEKVKTTTLNGYFLKILKNQGVDIEDKIDYATQIPQEYLQYIYSQKFVQDVQKRLAKIYDGVVGLFTAQECSEIINEIILACKRQKSIYENIKNSNLRVRRTVLGEIKEKADGGLYYTKQFRQLFNAVGEVEEFLSLNFNDAKLKNYSYFYRQLLSFYKAIRFVRRYNAKICESAINDLLSLNETVEREIKDLMRYKRKIGNEEVFTYAERMEKRRQTIKEISKTINGIKAIAEDFFVACDFADVIKGDSALIAIGKCENGTDITRFFYKEIIKKAKTRFGVSLKKMNITDPFAIAFILKELGFNLTPRYAFVFVDEAQDISPAEYSVLKQINSTAKFNVFGDLKQNVTYYRGINSWQQLGYKSFELNLNYRNTNQIVEHVSKTLAINMQPVGFDGEEVEHIYANKVTSWLNGQNGIKAIITSEQDLQAYHKKSYNLVRQTGKISKKQINLLTVYESKGLEFSAVAVADEYMTGNEKYIAYTRALKNLAIIKK